MRVQGPFKIAGCLRVAVHNTLISLQPVVERAEREKLFFRCKWTGIKFTPKQLVKELKRYQWVRGPQCWHLIDSQGRRVA